MPDFIKDFYDEITDENIKQSLQRLSEEYKSKRDHLSAIFNLQNITAARWKLATNYSLEQHPISYCQLDREYIQKTMDIAIAGIDDEDKFEALVNEHLPAHQDLLV